VAANDEELVILEKVEELRQRLARAVGSIKSLNDERIVELSQELDCYILKIQKKNCAERQKIMTSKGQQM